jgi:hypothetical protein
MHIRPVFPVGKSTFKYIIKHLSFRDYSKIWKIANEWKRRIRFRHWLRVWRLEWPYHNEENNYCSWNFPVCWECCWFVESNRSECNQCSPGESTFYQYSQIKHSTHVLYLLGLRLNRAYSEILYQARIYVDSIPCCQTSALRRFHLRGYSFNLI